MDSQEYSKCNVYFYRNDKNMSNFRHSMLSAVILKECLKKPILSTVRPSVVQISLLIPPGRSVFALNTQLDPCLSTEQIVMISIRLNRCIRWCVPSLAGPTQRQVFLKCPSKFYKIFYLSYVMRSCLL